MNMTAEEAKLFVGEGWHSLIDKIFAILPNDAYIVQVKEKYGGLRFYVDNVSDYILDVIEEAEKESYTLCETCGEPGEPRIMSWILTLCDKHYKEAISDER